MRKGHFLYNLMKVRRLLNWASARSLAEDLAEIKSHSQVTNLHHFKPQRFPKLAAVG